MEIISVYTLSTSVLPVLQHVLQCGTCTHAHVPNMQDYNCFISHKVHQLLYITIGTCIIIIIAIIYNTNIKHRE